MRVKCPGQDTRFWKEDDIYVVPCPKCGSQVEFFKDDRSRKCKECGVRFKNPHLDLGCIEWCRYAKECMNSEFLEELKDEQEKRREQEGAEQNGNE